MSLTIKMEVNPGLNTPTWMIIRFLIFVGALLTTFTWGRMFFYFFFYYIDSVYSKMKSVKGDNFVFIQEILVKCFLCVK